MTPRLDMLHLADTIIAPATCEGTGAISILRLSGPAAFETAFKFLEPKKAFPNVKPKLAYMLRITDEKGEFVDQAVVLFHRKPKSYTGEDMVEILCHGSPYILRKTLQLAAAGGARYASPGEFTLRAFLNGKMDLTQAEAVNDLILSENELSHKSAVRQLEGSVKNAVNAVKSGLVDLLSEIEARIDDSEEITGEMDFEETAAKLSDLNSRLFELAGSFEKGKFVKNGIRVSIVGPANAGKSSLLNSLLGYERAIVTPRAGTTTDVIEEKIELFSLPFVFSDTAGMNPKNPDIVEKEGIARTKERIKMADIIVRIKDASVPFGGPDAEIEKVIRETARPGTEIINALNKTDLPKKFSRKGWFEISCKTGKGLQTLKRVLAEKQKRVFGCQSSAVITSERHCQALRNAGDEISRLKSAAGRKNFTPEKMAENLKTAINHLSGITGEFTNEDLLANIFSRFCVGK